MTFCFEMSGPVRQMTPEQLAAWDARPPMPPLPVAADGTVSWSFAAEHIPPSRTTVNGLPWRTYFLLYLPKRLRAGERARRLAEERERMKDSFA